MEVKVIGTGAIGAKNSSACTLIDKRILIDCGNGITKKIKQLRRRYLKYRSNTNYTFTC